MNLIYKFYKIIEDFIWRKYFELNIKEDEN